VHLVIVNGTGGTRPCRLESRRFERARHQACRHESLFWLSGGLRQADEQYFSRRQ
jgi:hypothetical protein